MNGEEARQALATAFVTGWEAAHPTYEIFAEGIRDPDLTNQEVAFVTLKISLPRVSQAELGDNPMKRYEGLVELGLFVPEGQGTKKFFEMNDTIVDTLAVQVINGIRMYSATTIERQPAVGWQSREVLVNYSFDSIN